MSGETGFTTPGGFILHDLLAVKESWPGGISYATIAKRAGLSKSHVVRLFQGKGNPSVTTLCSLANALSRTLSFELLDPPEKVADE